MEKPIMHMLDLGWYPVGNVVRAHQTINNKYEDEDGVPSFVQGIKYNYGTMTVEYLLFNGHHGRVAVDAVHPDMSMTKHMPDTADWLTFAQGIEKLCNEVLETKDLRSIKSVYGDVFTVVPMKGRQHV